MIGETLVILSLLSGGSLLALGVGLRGWPVPAVGYALGVALHVGLTGLIAVSSLPTTPWVPVALVFVGPIAWWIRCSHREGSPGFSMAGAGLVLAVTVVLVAALRSIHLVNVTPDSFRYLTTGGLLGSDRLEEASPFLLESRLLAVPAMHAPAALSGELYLRAVTPLLAISCVLILAWLVRTGLHSFVGPPPPSLIAVTAALLLATTNRFVFHAFYLNGHLALATWLLLLGGVSWLAVRRPEERLVPGLVVIQILVVPAIVLTRPEAGLVAGLVLLPLLVVEGIPDRLRWPAFASLGISMGIWQGYLAVGYRGDMGAAPTSVDGLFAIGLVVATSSVVIWRRGVHWLPRRTLGVVEVVMWLMVIVAAVTDPRILLSSGWATLVNLVGDGGWGVAIIIMAALVATVLICTDVPGRIVLRFPLTAFVPLLLLLPYLRDGAYRVGPGDSLNRMLMHLLPLAVLFVVSAFVTRRWGRAEAGVSMVTERSEPPR